MSFLKNIFSNKSACEMSENDKTNNEIDTNKNSKQEILPNRAEKELKENFLEKNKGAIEVSSVNNQAKQEIEKILYENDLDKLKYFIRRFFLENTGTEPKISVSKDKLNIDFEMFKPKISISEIILKLIKNANFKFDKIDYSEVLKGEYFAIKFYSNSYLNFDIIPIKSVNEKFLISFKEILEKYFVLYLENTNEYKLSEEEIAKILYLDANDKLTFMDGKLSILLDIKNFENINLQLVMGIANSIANLGKYLIRVKSFLGNIGLYVSDEINSYMLNLSATQEGLLVEIGPNKYETKITRKFLQSFVKNFILTLKKLSNQEENLIEKLKSLGVKVEKYPQKENIEELFMQKGFVGYEDVKEQIITHVINPWKNKEKYENFVKENLPNIKNIVPNAVLFYGVPGTGKTTMASIIGEYLGYPFVYIPVNSIMSKWFGESENRLNDILETCGKLAKKEGGVVIMIDEIDEIGKNREETSSDASNRILGVLLKKLDGLEKLDNILLIGGTNLPGSLDSALLSRFSQQIEFRLPNEKEIVAILKYYLPILEENGLEKIAEKLKGKSGRDIKKLSEDFARYVIKEDIKENYLEKFISFLDKNATNYSS